MVVVQIRKVTFMLQIFLENIKFKFSSKNVKYVNETFNSWKIFFRWSWMISFNIQHKINKTSLNTISFPFRYLMLTSVVIYSSKFIARLEIKN